MDSILDSVLPTLPSAGLGGVVIWLLVLVIKRESTVQDRFNAEYQRIADSHRSEVAELREQIEALRDRVEALNNKLDEEREERRKAEDETAALRRRLDTT